MSYPESSFKGHIIKTSPPYDVIKLPQPFNATGDFMSFNAYYQDESYLIIHDDVSSILRNTMNTSSIHMWKEFTKGLPHLNKTELPMDLTSMRSISLEFLIDKLRSARCMKTSKDTSWSNYYYLIIVFVMSLVSGKFIYVIGRINTCKLIEIQESGLLAEGDLEEARGKCDKWWITGWYGS